MVNTQKGKKNKEKRKERERGGDVMLKLHSILNGFKFVIMSGLYN